MAGVLLVLFPLLLMVNTPLAWMALAAAIVMLVSKRFGAARQTTGTHVEHDASI
jgi:hypothetical protein